MKYELTAHRLREAMDDIGITQQELSEKSGIGKSSISHYINGTNEPGNKSAYAIAKILNVNPAWLMGLDNHKHIEEVIIKPAQPNTASKAYIKEYIAQLAEKFSNYSPEEIERAIRVFEIYEKSTPEVRASIELLLGSTPRKP